jgi:septal ring-binding cell division protein DamX
MVRASIRRILASPVIDGFVRVLVVASVIGFGIAWGQARDASTEAREATEQNRRLTECVAAYNDVNNQRTVAIAQATDDERTAQRKTDDAAAALFLSPSLGNPQRSPLEQAELVRLLRLYQAALANQRKERADADDARREHPIPDPPSQVCG